MRISFFSKQTPRSPLYQQPFFSHNRKLCSVSRYEHYLHAWFGCGCGLPGFTVSNYFTIVFLPTRLGSEHRVDQFHPPAEFLLYITPFRRIFVNSLQTELISRQFISPLLFFFQYKSPLGSFISIVLTRYLKHLHLKAVSLMALHNNGTNQQNRSLPLNVILCLISSTRS